MWIVRIALSKPYTFIVLALLILILGALSIYRTPTDIFPNIKIPVVSVVWFYQGLSPEEMGERITFLFERQVTVTVTDISYMDSQSILGMSVVKIYFQPYVDLGLAISEITAMAQTVLKYLPPGTLPPLVFAYNASSIPTLQLAITSDELSEQEMFDYANNFIRTQFSSVSGSSIPLPYGGKIRQVMVDLDHEKMQMYNVTPEDVNNALTQQNLIFPAGTQKIGLFENYTKLNNQPRVLEELNMLPIRNKNGALYYMRDIGDVRDGFPPQTNIVRINGQRAVLMPVQKIGHVSTLGIINGIKEMMDRVKASLPSSLNLEIVNDQSFFIDAAISSVVREIIIAAALTGLLIILFLGNWRGTLIIWVSIPLSILSGVVILSALGETFNIMTLGGFALAVGILVDDATVTIENIDRNLAEGKELEPAIIDAADQILIPLFVSTLCICIVFAPMFFLTDIARYLFAPLAEAVIFSMLSSYFLSRTLVATLAKYLLHKPGDKSESKIKMIQTLSHLQKNFVNKFNLFRDRYHAMLYGILQQKKLFMSIFLLFIGLSILTLMPWVGSDFFPTVDGGRFNLHARAPTGTRVEETARLVAEIDDYIRTVIPPAEIESIVDNMGIPVSGINLTYGYPSTFGPEDADILVSLKSGHHPTADYIRILREELPKKFPGVSFSFIAADIVNQILNFGLPALINVKIVGFKISENFEYAKKMLEKIKHIPGVVDALIQQNFNYPQINIDIDRSLALELGVTELDAATSAIFAFYGSFQLAPTFWLDYDNTVSYPFVVQTPQYRLTNMQQMANIPLSGLTEKAQILGAIATFNRSGVEVVQTHHDSQPAIDIFANVQDRDLGGVTHDINKVLQEMKKELPKGSYLLTGGQMKTKEHAFKGLYFGILFAVIFVYLLIVVNFQSWLDPFIIITALPAAIAGMTWMLFLTGTTVSVPALIGAVMCMGVATANSILVISFARTAMREGADAITAVLNAATTRFRPVLMTALAMIIGMIPMALALGEGGEQNAPLGRTVIGGLLFATVATLVFVPCAFALFHSQKKPVTHEKEKRE